MRIVIPVFVFLMVAPLAALAFKEGPYPNVTGGFGEQSCHLCHLDNAVNAPGGTLTLEGVPESYVPGKTYQITVALARAGMRRGGFEIAARFASGRQKGKQAGSWKISDGRLQLIPGAVDKSLTFVQHNLMGSRTATPGSNTWTIEWTAPDRAAGPVQFNVAANASNNDDSPLGDYIYLKQVTSAIWRSGDLRFRSPITRSPDRRFIACFPSNRFPACTS
jgi:hypothetical protein